MICFDPPEEGFGWSPNDWIYPPGRDIKFSIYSDWYHNKDELPGPGELVFNLTKDGQPIG